MLLQFLLTAIFNVFPLLAFSGNFGLLGTTPFAYKAKPESTIQPSKDSIESMIRDFIYQKQVMELECMKEQLNKNDVQNQHPGFKRQPHPPNYETEIKGNTKKRGNEPNKGKNQVDGIKRPLDRPRFGTNERIIFYPIRLHNSRPRPYASVEPTGEKIFRIRRPLNQFSIEHHPRKKISGDRLPATKVESKLISSTPRALESQGKPKDQSDFIVSLPVDNEIGTTIRNNQKVSDENKSAHQPLRIVPNTNLSKPVPTNLYPKIPVNHTMFMNRPNMFRPYRVKETIDENSRDGEDSAKRNATLKGTYFPKGVPLDALRNKTRYGNQTVKATSAPLEKQLYELNNTLAALLKSFLSWKQPERMARQKEDSEGGELAELYKSVIEASRLKDFFLPSTPSEKDNELINSQRVLGNSTRQNKPSYLTPGVTSTGKPVVVLTSTPSINVIETATIEPAASHLSPSEDLSKSRSLVENSAETYTNFIIKTTATPESEPTIMFVPPMSRDNDKEPPITQRRADVDYSFAYPASSTELDGISLLQNEGFIPSSKSADTDSFKSTSVEAATTEISLDLEASTGAGRASSREEEEDINSGHEEYVIRDDDKISPKTLNDLPNEVVTDNSLETTTTTSQISVTTGKNGRKMNYNQVSDYYEEEYEDEEEEGKEDKEDTSSTNSIEDEQRRSDILINEGTKSEKSPDYLKRIRKLSSDSNATIDSIVPLVPAIVDDLRTGKISEADKSLLEEAFGPYWKPILELSQNENLDMLPLLKMKNENDLKEILGDGQTATTTTTAPLAEQPKFNPFYYDDYKDMYVDGLDIDFESKKRRLRLRKRDVLKS